MVTNLCVSLTCLLIPVLIELFNLQGALHLSNTGHAAAEVLILLGIYWLFVQILRLDEQLYLRNLLQQNTHPKATVPQVRRELIVMPMPKAEAAKPELSREPELHGLRIRFGNILKRNRTIKPL